MLLLALIVLAGATPLARRTVIPVPAAPRATAYLSAGGVFVVDPSTPTEDRHLTAYALPAANGDVRRRWQMPLPGAGNSSGFVGARVERGLVLLTEMNTDDGVWETVAFDASTGGQRWRLAGFPSWTADGGLLLNAFGEGSGAVSRVAPDTGLVLWSVPVPTGGYVSYHGDDVVDRFVLFRQNGEVQVHDATSGRLLRSVDTLPGDRSESQQQHVAGELVLLLGADRTRLEAYGLSELDRRWTAELPGLAFAARCGDLLCAFKETGGIAVLDPATGAVRWAATGEQGIGVVRADRLLTSGLDRRQIVRELATGRVVAELGRWDVLPRVRPDDPLIGVRPGSDGRLVVAELDLAAGRSRIIDMLPRGTNNCQASSWDLLCARLDGSTALFRLRP
ncbi:hypothetical protein GCM10027614_68800 [Micromonospora vulcania]